jgi:uncharacterized protein YfaT (DUF1175 family)
LIQAARQAMTRKWWDQGCSGLEAFTSQETLDKIGRGDQNALGLSAKVDLVAA